MTSDCECLVKGCFNKRKCKGLCGAHYQRLMTYGTLELRYTQRGVGLQWLRDHVNFHGEECLIWPFPRTRIPYVQFDGRNQRAARVMCILAHGQPTFAQAEAAHSCGKGHLGCVNPQHLRWASRQENVDDRTLHGTNPIGEKHGMAKLRTDDVAAILASQESQKSLAEKYRVSAATISMIKSRRTWAHVN